MLYFQQLFRDSGVSRNNWRTISSVMINSLDLSDERALALAGQGDQEAFGVLYERYVGRIYSYIYYRTGNQHDAEDLTARVFFRALRHIENYTDRGLPFSAWLYRIAHNLVANWHRDNSRRKEVPLEDMIWIHFNSEHPEAALLQNEEQESLLLVIRDLPADRQQLLILKFVEHLSNAEIGVIMGRTEGAVKSLYHRTLLSLRDGYLQVKHNGSDTSEEYLNGNWMG
jgi:RNA polymerase sigma-70 factor (ECF subfamily)